MPDRLHDRDGPGVEPGAGLKLMAARQGAFAGGLNQIVRPVRVTALDHRIAPQTRQQGGQVVAELVGRHIRWGISRLT